MMSLALVSSSSASTNYPILLQQGNDDEKKEDENETIATITLLYRGMTTGMILDPSIFFVCFKQVRCHAMQQRIS